MIYCPKCFTELTSDHHRNTCLQSSEGIKRLVMNDIPKFTTTTYDKTIRIDLNKLDEAKELVKVLRHSSPTYKRNAFTVLLGTHIRRNILNEEREVPTYKDLTYITQKILELLDEVAREIDDK